jgi:hypothetical protein
VRELARGDGRQHRALRKPPEDLHLRENGGDDRYYPAHIVLCSRRPRPAAAEGKMVGSAFRRNTWSAGDGCHTRKPAACLEPEPRQAPAVKRRWRVQRRRERQRHCEERQSAAGRRHRRADFEWLSSSRFFLQLQTPCICGVPAVGVRVKKPRRTTFWFPGPCANGAGWAQASVWAHPPRRECFQDHYLGPPRSGCRRPAWPAARRASRSIC